MKIYAFVLAILCSTHCVVASAAILAAEGETRFTNQNGVANTRHNMTQHTAKVGGDAETWMEPYRNNYNEVCVYCHTPHGANSDAAASGAPLWNRTMQATVYTNYTSQTINGVVNNPGIQSRTCLSCHDGTTAVDSIINMPGSGRYDKTQEIAQNNAFLNNSWTNSSGTDAGNHWALKSTQCNLCHQAAGFGPNFTVAEIGPDLRNDHPVGIDYLDPATNPGVDFVGGLATKNNIQFFDKNGNGNPDKEEIRMYNNRLECGTCHDPHGVPSGAAGSTILPTFMRVTNAGGALCLSCHIK